MSNKNAELISASLKFEVNANDDTGVTGIHKALEDDAVGANLDNIGCEFQTTNDKSEKTMDFTPQKMSGKKKSVNFIEPVKENTSKSSKKKGKKKSKGKSKKSASEKAKQNDDALNEISDTAQVSVFNDEAGIAEINLEIDRPTCSKEVDNVMSKEATTSQVDAPDEIKIEDKMDGSYTQNLDFVQEENTEVIEEVETKIILPSIDIDKQHVQEINTAQLLEELSQTINSFSELQEENPNNSEIEITSQAIEEVVSIERIEQNTFDIQQFEDSEICTTKERNVESPKSVHFELDMENDMGNDMNNLDILNKEETEINANLAHDDLPEKEDNHNIENDDAEIKGECKVSDASSSSSSSSDDEHKEVKTKKMKKRKRRIFNFHFPKFGNKKKKNSKATVELESDTLPTTLIACPGASDELEAEETNHISCEGDAEVTVMSSVKEDGRSDECKDSSEVDLKTDNTIVTCGTFNANIPTFEGCLEISNSENVELNLSDNSKQEDCKLNDKPDDSGESIIKEKMTELELREGVETTGRKTIDLQMDLARPLDTTATRQSEVNEGKEETKKEEISANVGIHMSGFERTKVLVVDETDNIENNSSLEKDSTNFEDANVWVNMNLDMDTNKSDAEKLLESGGVSQPITNFKTDNTCQGERDILLNIGNEVDIGNQDEDDLYPMELEVQNCAGVEITQDIALKSNNYDNKIKEESNLGSVSIDVGVTRNDNMDQFVLENGQKTDIVNDAQTVCITQGIGVDARFEGATEGVPMEDKNLEIQWTGKDIASSSTSSDDEVLKLSKGKKRKKKKTKKKTKKNKGIFGSGFARQISGGKKEKPDFESLAISPDIEGDNECIAWQEIPKKAQVILGTDRIKAAENIKPVKKEDPKVLDLGTTMEADSKETNTENKIVHIKFARAVSNCSDHNTVIFDDKNGDKMATKSEDLRIDVDKEDLQTSEGIESENKHGNKKKKGFFSGFHMPGFGNKHKKGSVDMEESIDNSNIAIDINIPDTNKGIVINDGERNSETLIQSVSILDDDKEFSEDRYRPAVDDVNCEISSKSSEEDKHMFDMNLKERNNRKIWNMKDTAISDSSSENIDVETEVSPEISFDVPGIERKDCNIGVETPQHLDCDLNTTSLNVDPKFTVVKDSNFEGNGEVRDLDKDVDESCPIENESNLDIEFNLSTISDDCEGNNQAVKKNRFSGFNVHIPHFGGRKKNEIESSQNDGIDVDSMHPELNVSVCPEESEINAIAQTTDVTLKEEIDVKNHSTSELKGDVSGDFPIDISTTESSDLKGDEVKLSSKHEKKKKGLFAKGIQFPKFGGKKHRNKMIEIEESKADTDIPQSNQIIDNTSSIENEIKDADAEVQISGISTSLNVDVELNEDNFEEFETPEFGTDFQQKELECIPEEGVMENENVSKSRSSSSDDISDHNVDINAKNKKKGFFSGINIHLPSFSWKRNKGVVDCDSTPMPGMSDQVQSGVGLNEGKPSIEGTIEIHTDTSIEADIDADIDIEELKTDIDPGVLHLEDRDVLALDTIEENPDIEDLSLKATIDGGITINSDVEIGDAYDDGNGNKEKEMKKSKTHKKKGLLGGIHFPRIGDKKKKDNLIGDLTTSSPDIDIKAEHDKCIDTNNLVVSELPDSNLNAEELEVCMPDVDARVQSQKLSTNAVVDTDNEIECQLPKVLDYPTEDAESKIDVDDQEIKLHPQLHININMENKGENIDIPTQNLEMENVPKHETEDINVTLPDIGNVLLNQESSSIVFEVETPELHTSAEINIDQPETKEISSYNINLGIERDHEDATKLDTCTLQDIQDSEVNVDNPILFENEVDANIKLSEPTTKNGVDSYDLGESQPLSVNLKTDIDEIVKTKLESDIQIVKQPPPEKLQTEYYIQQSEKSATLPQTKLDFKPRVSRGISIEGSVKMRLRKGSSEPELSSPKSKKKKKRFTLPSFNFPNFWNRKNKTNKIDMDTENLRRPKSMEVLPSSTNGVNEDVKIEPRPLSLSLPISIEEEDSTLLPSSSVDIEPAESSPDISVDKSLQVKNIESEIDGGQLDEVINSKPKKKIKMPSLNFQLSKSKKEKVYKEKIVIDQKEELDDDGVEMQKPIIKLKAEGEADISDLSLNASGLELPSDRENISTSVEDVVDTIEIRPQLEGQERNNLDTIKIDTPEHKQVDVIIKDSHEPLKLNISSTGGGITDINKDLPSPAFTASDSGLSSGVGEGEVSLPGFGCPEEFSVNAGISAEVDPSADVSAMETSCSSQADEDIKSSSSSHSLVEKNKRKGFRLPKISFSGKRKSKTLPAVVSPSGTVKAHNYSLSSDDSVAKLSKGKKRKDLKDESIFDDTDDHLKLSGDVSFNLEGGPSTSTPLKSVHRNNSNACDPENTTELPEDPSVLPIQFTTTYKVVIAIDFGSTFSGYAYCFPTNPEEIFVMRKWQGGDPGVRNTKMPSTLLLTPEGEFHSFGFVARDFYHDMEHKEAQKWLYFNNFKMPLHTNQNLDLDTEIEAGNGIHVPAIKLFELALAFFKERALQDVSDRSDHQVDQQDIRWVLTVPAIWKQQAKQFIRKATYLAGIGSPSNPDQLTIALEPEAASIYIRQLKKTEFVPDKSKRKSIIEVENMNASLYTVPENLTKGCRYIVVDCGGGTVDITVHQIEDHHGLVEVHRASGGTFGSISVDRQFQKLLVEICGQDFIDEFKIKRPAGWVDLMIAFEARKRNIQPWKSNPLNVSLPFSFIDYYKKFTKTSTVEYALKVYNSEDVKWSPQGMIRFSLEGMQSLFQPSINNITECIEQVLNEPNIGNVSHLFIVGGFAESPFVKNTIRNQFQDRLQVIIPPDVTMAVVKGAVMYGMDPTVIRVRKSKLTYGVGVLNKFDSQKHPQKKKVVKDNVEWCLDVFDKLVEVDQAVQTGEKVCRSYTPAKPDQKEILITIYCSEKKNVKFITDAGVKKFGTLKIDLSMIEQLNDLQRREIRLTMQYGDTEIKVSALDVLTGHCVKVNIDFEENVN